MYGARSTSCDLAGLSRLARVAWPLLAVGCGGQATDAPVVRVGSPTRIASIAPALSWDYYHAQVASYVFEGLTHIGEDGRVRPCLAREWRVSPDGLVYRFRLRDATFHDGSPFRAADVLRAWTDALREQEGELTHPWMLDPIAGAREFSAGLAPGVSGLAAPDDSTLVVRLREPLAFFPTLLTLPQSFIPAAASDPTTPFGTGPWRWASSDSAAGEVRLARYAAYWGQSPRLDSLIYRFVPDSQVARAFEDGWVDMASELPAPLRVEWSVRSDIGFVESDALNLTRLVINFREPVFHDRRVRLALNHAIAVARLATTTGAATAVRAAGVIPPALPGAAPNRAPYAFDPVLARTLLRESTYPLERPIRLWVPGPGLSDYPPEIGTFLRDYLQAAGFVVDLRVQSRGLEEAMANREADIILSVWVGDYADGDAFLYPLYHSNSAGSAGNEGFYENPALDRVIDASRRERDPTRRAALLRTADSLVFADAPAVFLWFTRTTTAYSLRLTGWGRDPQYSRFTLVRVAGTPDPEEP